MAPVPVLLMVRELHLGGTERQLTEIARTLDRSRFSPHVACFRSEGLRAAELEAASVPVIQLPVRSFRHPSVIGAARRLTAYIKKHGIQLVHTFDVPATVFGVPAARTVPGVTVLSSQRAHRELAPRVFRPLLRMTDKLVHGIVVNCEAIRRQLVEQEGVPDSIVHVCYNGIDTRMFAPAPQTSLYNDGVRIGVVCALRPEKNLPSLLDAFARVRSERAGVKLVIVGSGPCLPDLMRRAGELGVDADCTFEPATNRVAEWLRSFDIFVLPSLSEALSNSLMEAMACGCAVVATRVGGNVELVVPGTSGLLYQSGDLAALTASLLSLIDNAELRWRMGAAAAQRMATEFSLERSAERMGEIYTLVRGGQASPRP